MKKVWKKLSSQVVYKYYPHWQIRRDKIINHSGENRVYEYIEKKDFVVIIGLVNNDKNIYLVRQWRYPVNNNSWEFSMGGIEKNETPFHC